MHFNNRESIVALTPLWMGEAYRDLDWSKEYVLACNGGPNDTQTAL